MNKDSEDKEVRFLSRTYATRLGDTVYLTDFPEIPFVALGQTTEDNGFQFIVLQDITDKTHFELMEGKLTQ